MMPDSAMMPENEQPALEKLAQRVEHVGSPLCVGLDFGPHTVHLLSDAYPTPEAFNRHLVAQTHTYAAAYKLQLAGYLALGAEGLDALRQTIAHIRQAHPTIPLILDAKFSDISVSLENYTAFAFDWLKVDALTANPLLGHDANRPLLDRPGRLVYFLCSTSNPGSADFQGFGAPDPLYLEIAERVAGWKTAGACGLVVGATHPDRIRAIRTAAPDLPFLMPGLGAQGGQPESFLPPALSGHPGGVLVNVSRGIMLDADPAAAARRFARLLAGAGEQPPALPLTRQQRTADLLAETGCIQSGEFTLASGETSNVYIDLRLLSGHPAALAQIARLLDDLTAPLAYDLIATIPTAGLPLGTALALRTGKPLIYVRKDAKDYGRQKQIEGGRVEPGQRILILDDVISTGGSKVLAVDVLRDLDVEIAGLAVVVDRRDPPGDPFMGVPVHALVTLNELK